MHCSVHDSNGNLVHCGELTPDVDIPTHGSITFRFHEDSPEHTITLLTSEWLIVKYGEWNWKTHSESLTRGDHLRKRGHRDDRTGP